jgi:hypothetical protein
MADPISSPTAGAENLAGKVADALADILRSSVSPEAQQAQNLLLRRLAVAGDVFSSRVPPPRNITEVGGYMNLLESLNESDMREQVLAATLGVAGPNPTPGFSPSSPLLYDAQRTNDRPAGPAQASIPVQFAIRNDFAPAFDGALKIIHDAGCALPILSPPRGLPAAGPGVVPPTDLLSFLGRTLDLMPTAALIDPDADPLAVAHVGATSLEVVARQLDPAAPNAASVLAQTWSAFKCDANACAEVAASRTYLSLTPVLNAVGWYQKPAITGPVKLSQPGAWNHWINITGLIPNVTTFGGEMSLRVTRGELAGSSLRDALTWVWDGTAFKAP